LSGFVAIPWPLRFLAVRAASDGGLSAEALLLLSDWIREFALLALPPGDEAAEATQRLADWLIDQAAERRGGGRVA
jgi:hypothetical protein